MRDIISREKKDCKAPYCVYYYVCIYTIKTRVSRAAVRQAVPCGRNLGALCRSIDQQLTDRPTNRPTDRPSSSHGNDGRGQALDSPHPPSFTAAAAAPPQTDTHRDRDRDGRYQTDYVLLKGLTPPVVLIAPCLYSTLLPLHSCFATSLSILLPLPLSVSPSLFDTFDTRTPSSSSGFLAFDLFTSPRTVQPHTHTHTPQPWYDSFQR